MRRVTDFPCAAEEHRHLAIPMLDGTTLSARLWLPEGALRTPVPAILEYIPYRKNDATYPRDAEVHRHFAGHGYASVRLDIRGSGESEGIMTDEYTEQELQDGFDAIQWLAHATPNSHENRRRSWSRESATGCGAPHARRPALRRGPRVRAAIPTGSWPIACPSPEPLTLSLVAAANALELPKRTPGPGDGTRKRRRGVPQDLAQHGPTRSPVSRPVVRSRSDVPAQGSAVVASPAAGRIAGSATHALRGPAHGPSRSDALAASLRAQR